MHSVKQAILCECIQVLLFGKELSFHQFMGLCDTEYKSKLVVTMLWLYSSRVYCVVLFAVAL